ncbi:uncharacterized protein N7458_004297 [Penicillium daleae]|uniref:Uncharacterized protein n=1 Tax=Penicillium daleae TaxID=63821 RepID=A0AAD6CBR1_9EURO|nr:uncharacterized protein N7458_004297 [Penicillium daleae]KAJ5456033.1 hypothetical protein N7458_004297 [Penicillium daleae]
MGQRYVLNVIALEDDPPSAEDSSEFKAHSAPKIEDKDIQGPNYTVIINPDDKGAARGVYIDLRKATVTLKGKDEVSQTTAKRLNTIIKSAIEDYFAEAAAIDYYLAGVSNDYKSQAADHVLRPVSFCFTTVMGNNESEVKSALCMWIAVQGGKDGGRKPTGTTQVTFHPGSSDLISIPKGSTAGLIPNLSKGFDDIKETTVAGEGGLKFTGKLKADTVSVEKVDDSESGTGWWWYTKMDAIEFEPSDPLTNITISGGISSNQKVDDNRIKYTSNGQSANWEWGQTVSGVDSGDSGTVELVFT